MTEGLGFRYLDHKPSPWKVKNIDLLPGKPKILLPGELPSIRNIIYSQLGIKSSQPDLKILYTREDAFRRRILNSPEIADLFDVVVDNLEIPFSQQVQLFSRASHFVAPEGAHMTNLIVMNPAASVLSLQVEQHNSWPEMLGTSSLVRSFDTSTTIVSGLKPPCTSKSSPLGAKTSQSLNVASLREIGDMDIVANKHLRDVIRFFLNEE